ncbi:CcoQ/FixQ family Cbb3-type cytochrome c oxidase assembly chaperone [Roseivirga sp. BDSF3-8]|uniref:CcoQ/FixQ family Cbb3-type cytochrome c oxidase assembly chaperone n=1 Tax=Roseivirga sp. BDSF3-8 TaxID=3241598 RepID=UPI0035324B71
MLKFIKHHMESISGIDIYPLFSLIVFFLFFTVLIVLVMRTGKSKIDEVAAMPLDTDTLPTNLTSHE